MTALKLAGGLVSCLTKLLTSFKYLSQKEKYFRLAGRCGKYSGFQIPIWFGTYMEKLPDTISHILAGFDMAVVCLLFQPFC